MKKNKCICKRYKEGYINLKCPVHTGQPKIDPKWKINDPKALETVWFTNYFFGEIKSLKNE